jgi:hypothetical protein
MQTSTFYEGLVYAAIPGKVALNKVLRVVV